MALPTALPTALRTALRFQGPSEIVEPNTKWKPVHTPPFAANSHSGRAAAAAGEARWRGA